MADFNALETLINAYIKKNGVQAITGNILNGVLRGMVSALGKGYTIVGVATPSTDPGTLTGPCAYYASTYGTYTNFGNIVVNDGEIAMLIYDEQTWHKEKMWRLDAEASIDANVGTPSVETSFEDELLTFRFHNIKGNPGDAAGFGTVTASVDSNIGTPGVSVQTSGPDTAKNMTFQFTNLKGETGVTSVVCTVDNTIGTPSCAVSLVGQELHLDFSGLKGAQGDTGVSADYPITIVNNLTTSDPTSALSAQMGVQLESEISQLELKVDDVSVLQKCSIRVVEITDFSSFALRSRYPDSGVWKTGTSASAYKHTLLPVNGAIAVKVYANSSNDAMVAFLTNFDAPVSGESVPFVSGVTNVTTIQANTSLFMPVPTDANALYVIFGRSADGYPRKPTKVTIYYSVPSENKGDITPSKRITPHTYVAGGYRMQSTIASNASYSTWFCEVKTGDIVTAIIKNNGTYLSHGFTAVPAGDSISVDQYAQDTGGNRVYNYTAPYDGFFNIGGGTTGTTEVTFHITRKIAGLATEISVALKKYPKRGVNLITEDCIFEGAYVSGTTGNYVSSGEYCSVEVLFPADDMRIYLKHIYAGYFALFDKDGNIVLSKGSDSADRIMYSGFRLPKGVVRGRFTSQVTKATLLSTGYISYYHPLTQAECANRVAYEDSYDNTPQDVIPTEYTGRDMSTFRHIVCCGDSLTQGVFNHNSGSGELDTTGYDYPANLASISGRAVVNLGYGGATSASWLARFTDDARLSGNDCAIIQLGINDNESTLDTTSRTAFIGIINRLKELNNGIKIFLAGIINGQSYPCATSNETYYTKDQWIKSLYEELYASDSQVFLIDHAKYGHLRDDKADTYATYKDNYNMGHLSAYGYNRLAQDYYSYIGWVMHNNDQDFRAIQFIGTNYT